MASGPRSVPVGADAEDNEKLKAIFKAEVGKCQLRDWLHDTETELVHQTGCENCYVYGWETVKDAAIVKDDNGPMAIVVKRDYNEGAVRVFNETGNEEIQEITGPSRAQPGQAVMLVLSTGCDALTLGRTQVKYIRRS